MDIIRDLFLDPIEADVLDSFPAEESFQLEYKQGASGFPKSFWQTYSSFANTNGGIIVLGIKHSPGKALEAIGLNDDQLDRYRQDFFNSANNRKETSICLLNDSDIRVVDILPDRKKILAFHIPKADRSQRPVYIGTDPFTGTYKRNHEGDFPCTRDEVRRMMADADISHPPDSRILTGTSVNDLDNESLRQYRQLLRSDNPGDTLLQLEDIEFLIQLGGYRKDRRSGDEGVTLGGLLMFGKYHVITEPSHAPYFFPDYQERFDYNQSVRWTNRICADGTWEANLFQFYRRVWPKLSNGLPKPFKLNAEGAAITETPAHEALREAFMNAIVHADYSVNASLTCIQSPTGYEFSNPGCLLISQAQYYRGGQSAPRNTSLQKMFMRLGRFERAGFGARKILTGWHNSHWRRPYISEQLKPDRVSLYLDMLDMLPDDSMNLLRTRFGPMMDELYGDQLIVMALVQSEGQVSNGSLQSKVDQHPADITKMLQDLCKRGYLESSSHGRGRTYSIPASHKGEESISNLDSNGSILDSNEPNLDSNEPNLDSNEPNLDSNESNLDSNESNLDTTPPNLERWAGRKLQRQELEAAILEICRDWYRTVAQVAELLDKSEGYLINDVLPALVKKGLLERKYALPTHKGQAYRATIEGDKRQG